MLTKTPKVADEVFVTDRGFHNKTTLIGTSTVNKVGRTYLHVEVYRRNEKFKFDGTSGGNRGYELWDSEESYEAITKRSRERSEKIAKIKNIASDWNFGKNLRDEALDEILQLITPQVH
jgi:hypothetical protein